MLVGGAFPAPNPGSLFPWRKSDQNAAGVTPDPLLAQKVCIEIDSVLPQNQRFLRAYDLWRVSRPASAVALLKGEANLIFCDELPGAIEVTQTVASKNCNIPQSEGRQAKWDTRQTDYEGPAA